MLSKTRAGLLVVAVAIIGLAVSSMLLGLVALYSQREVRQLQRDYEAFQESYSKLREQFEQLKEAYASIQEQLAQLQSNYTLLVERYTRLQKDYEMLEARCTQNLKSIVEAERLLSRLASLMSQHGLHNRIMDAYKAALADKANYTLWEAQETPVFLEPQNFTYVMITPQYTGDVMVHWAANSASIRVLVLDVLNMLYWYSNKSYHAISTAEDVQEGTLHVKLRAGRTYAIIVYNKGSTVLGLRILKVIERVPVTAPLDLRKVFAVNYYVALNVPYVPNANEEFKPPLKTLSEGGDCEDRAVLVASLLWSLGYNLSRLAFAAIDTNGDRMVDHVSTLAQLPEGYDVSRLGFELSTLTIAFTGRDPYRSCPHIPNIMLVPASMVNGSSMQGYFIVIDPPDLTRGCLESTGIIPGCTLFEAYNIVFAETVESLKRSGG